MKNKVIISKLESLLTQFKQLPSIRFADDQVLSLRLMLEISLRGLKDTDGGDSIAFGRLAHLVDSLDQCYNALIKAAECVDRHDNVTHQGEGRYDFPEVISCVSMIKSCHQEIEKLFPVDNDYIKQYFRILEEIENSSLQFKKASLAKMQTEIEALLRPVLRPSVSLILRWAIQGKSLEDCMSADDIETFRATVSSFFQTMLHKFDGWGASTENERNFRAFVRSFGTRLDNTIARSFSGPPKQMNLHPVDIAEMSALIHQETEQAKAGVVSAYRDKLLDSYLDEHACQSNNNILDGADVIRSKTLLETRDISEFVEIGRGEFPTNIQIAMMFPFRDECGRAAERLKDSRSTEKDFEQTVEDLTEEQVRRICSVTCDLITFELFQKKATTLFVEERFAATDAIELYELMCILYRQYRRMIMSGTAVISEARSRIFSNLYAMQALRNKMPGIQATKQLTPAQPSLQSPLVSPNQDKCQFIKSGEGWKITFHGKNEFILKDMKGMGYLLLLLQHPNTEMYYNSFEKSEPANLEASQLDHQPLSIADGDELQGGFTSWKPEDSIALTDRKSKNQYEKEVKKLKTQIQQCNEGIEKLSSTTINDNTDPRIKEIERLEERLEDLKKQENFITKEIQNASFRKKEIPRQEKNQRKRISKAISESIEAIRKHDSDFANYLMNAISYRGVVIFNPKSVHEWEF